MAARKFESECWRCQGTIRTTDGGQTWRHLVSDTKHRASPHGIMREI